MTQRARLAAAAGRGLSDQQPPSLETIMTYHDCRRRRISLFWARTAEIITPRRSSHAQGNKLIANPQLRQKRPTDVHVQCIKYVEQIHRGHL